MSKLFWAMLSFITRLPVPRRWSQGLDFEHYSRGIITFPLIGLLLGAISGLVFMVLQAWCGAPLAALFSVLVLVLMTGGFHLDGLADTCDGVFSARSRDRMLEIMRDSRLGTHGGLALIFVVLAKILVLSELALRGEPILASLAAACAVSRGTAALLMYRHRYAREEGLGNVFIGKIDGRQTCVTLGLAAIFAAVLLPGMHGVAAM
ncbi:adenosylcobinamide-GDP ribazoletransferase, partial [Escherichia coli]